MKLTILHISLLLAYLTAVCQTKEKISILKDSKIKIINEVVDKDPNKLPIINFTIQNNSKEKIIFTTVALELINFKKHPLSSSSNNDLLSKELTPIAGYDLSMPIIPNTYLFGCKSPTQIGKKEAATIALRIYCQQGNKNIVPSQVGYFRFRILLITNDSKAVSSQEMEFGD